MLAHSRNDPARAETHHGPTEVAPMAADLRVGTRLAGYEVEALVGRGGMGIVYRARHVHLGRTAALKVLTPDLVESEDFRRRFIRESQTAAAINHPNIITVYDAGEADGLLYIAMQYVDGTDFAGLLQRVGRVELPEAVFLLDQVAGALDSAHAHGIVHRDVKPANVLIESKRCYLTDFGLTKRISSDSAHTAHGQFVGTIDYMAPEQIEGGQLDARTDVYALGCLLYHSIVGGVPYEKDSQVSVIYAHLQEPPPPPSTRWPELPPELDGVIAKALAKDREDRYPSCSALMSAARAVTEDGVAPLPPHAQTPRTPVTKVLVADSQMTTRALVRTSLPGERFRLLEATDGDAAIALARKERPALVLVDGSIRGPSGADVCRALRGDPQTAEAKIVAIGTRAQAREKQALIDAGADGCISKPFSPIQLLYTVRDQLGPDVLGD